MESKINMVESDDDDSGGGGSSSGKGFSTSSSCIRSKNMYPCSLRVATVSKISHTAAPAPHMTTVTGEMLWNEMKSTALIPERIVVHVINGRNAIQISDVISVGCRPKKYDQLLAQNANQRALVEAINRTAHAKVQTLKKRFDKENIKKGTTNSYWTFGEGMGDDNQQRAYYIFIEINLVPFIKDLHRLDPSNRVFASLVRFIDSNTGSDSSAASEMMVAFTEFCDSMRYRPRVVDGARRGHHARQVQ